MGGENRTRGARSQQRGLPADAVGRRDPGHSRVDAKPVIVIWTIAGLRAVGGRAPTTERTPVTTCSMVG